MKLIVARCGVGRSIGVVTAALIVVGAVSGLVVVGPREPAAAVRLLSGDAWLADGSLGSVTQVDGYAHRAGATVRLPAIHPGDPFTVIQRPDGAYVLDRKTGALEKVSSAGENVTATVTAKGKPSSLQLITGSGGTWMLDTSAGLLQQLNPKTLAAEGLPVHLPAPTGSGVMDSSGTIWVAIGHAGIVEEITNGSHSPKAHRLGRPGDQLQVTVADTGAWAVDDTTGTAISLTTPTTISFPPGNGATVGSSADSPDIVVVAGQNIHMLDTATASMSTVADPAANGVTQLAVQGTHAYLLNTATNSLITADLAAATAGPPVPLPGGPNQLVRASGLVFVNNVDGPTAWVVGPNGQTTPVTKYATAATQPVPSANPAPPASLPPVFNPSRTPVPILPSSRSVSAAPPANAAADSGGSIPSTTPINSGSGVTPPTVGNRGGGFSPTVNPSGGFHGTGTTGVGGTAPMTALPTAPTTAPTTTPTTTPTTAPVQPGQPTVSASQKGTTITVTWTPPSAGSSPITRYSVTCSGQSTQSTSVSASGQLQASFNNLTPGQYTCTVQAANQAGSGTVGTSNAVTIPSKPILGNLSVLSVDGKLEVSFTAATENFGSDPITYSLAVDGSIAYANATPGTTYTPNVSAGTHTVTLTAQNAEGSAGPETASGTSYSVEASFECDAGGGQFVWWPTLDGGCAGHNLQPTGYQMTVPVPGQSVPNAQPIYAWTHNAPATEAFTFTPTPPAAPASGWQNGLGGTSPNAVGVASSTAQPAFPTEFDEWINGSDQYRYLPAGQSPPAAWGGSLTNFKFFELK